MSKAMNWRYFLAGGMCLLILAACDKQKVADETVGQAMPDEVIQQPADSSSFIQGKAKEVLAGGGFTYILIATDKGDAWVAVPQTEVAVGEDCVVSGGQIMKDFPVKSLNRTFPEITFASGLEGKMPAAAVGPHGQGEAAAGPGKGGGDFNAALGKESSGGAPAGGPAMGEASPGSGKAVVPFADLKVNKATGANAYTVAELFAKGASLNGKKVKVKGQVVKFSPQIMGKNWLHLQDGTGETAKNTHDLVVTSAGKAEKGETVTVEGVLAANKDFGAGYTYVVIVEDAAIRR